MGLTGLMKPCGSSTSLIPAGVGLRFVYVAHGAIAGVARVSLRVHGRVADVGVTLIGAVNAVDQQVEIDTREPVHPGRPDSRCKRSIVAKNAHFHLVAVIAVEGQEAMALITGSCLNHRPARLHSRSID